MRFSEIVGRHKLISQLREMVEHNRLSHALLFLGKEGSGALRLAIAFAQFILCEKNKQTEVAMPSLFGDELPTSTEGISGIEDSCGQCPACVKVEKLVHPDLHFSFPVLKRDARHDRPVSADFISEWREFVFEFPFGNINDWLDFLKNSATAKIENAPNKQANISVFECEEILHKLSLKSYESDFKILIMWLPEFLGKDGNRLLKLIEEPPEGTIFIFVAEDENQILPTIISRTQLVKIPLPEDHEVEEYLNQQIQEPVNTKSIVAVASGNIREALRLTRMNEENWERSIRDWLNLIIRNNVDLQSKWIDEINQIGREKQKQLLLYFIHLIRISLKTGFLAAEDLPSMVESEREFAAILRNKCEPEVIEEMVKELNDAIYFIERNANSKILFHALTIKLRYLINEKYLILIQ